MFSANALSPVSKRKRKLPNRVTGPRYQKCPSSVLGFNRRSPVRARYRTGTRLDPRPFLMPQTRRFLWVARHLPPPPPAAKAQYMPQLRRSRRHVRRKGYSGMAKPRHAAMPLYISGRAAVASRPGIADACSCVWIWVYSAPDMALYGAIWRDTARYRAISRDTCTVRFHPKFSSR